MSASALNYWTCWVGSFKEDDMKKVLNTNLQPVTTIIIGYSDDNPIRPARKSLAQLTEEIKK